MATRFFDSARPLAFAHRGGAKRWPENTLAAFRGARDAGCAYIETDMRLTSDGEVVLFHDARVDRTTDGRGPVASLTLAQLQALDAGFHFRDLEGRRSYRGRGERAVTLQELAELDPALFLNIEIKPNSARAAERLYESIVRLGIEERVLIASAEQLAMDAFRRVAGPEIPTSATRREIVAFLAAVRSRGVLSRRKKLPFRALQVPVAHRGIRVIDAHFVSAAHRRGVQVHAWTIDTAAQIRRLVDIGVDGIMSDRPELLTRTLACSSNG